MTVYLNNKEIEPDNEGHFDARCSVCLKDKHCISITYPKIIEICESFDIPSYAFAICESCFNIKDKRWLNTNIMDYFVMNELTRWIMGEKTGIVRSELEFKTLLMVAEEQGIIYREEKRMRHAYTGQERQYQLGFINVLKRENTGDYTPNALYQNLFKRLYDG